MHSWVSEPSGLLCCWHCLCFHEREGAHQRKNPGIPSTVRYYIDSTCMWCCAASINPICDKNFEGSFVDVVDREL